MTANACATPGLACMLPAALLESTERARHAAPSTTAAPHLQACHKSCVIDQALAVYLELGGGLLGGLLGGGLQQRRCQSHPTALRCCSPCWKHAAQRALEMLNVHHDSELAAAQAPWLPQHILMHSLGWWLVHRALYLLLGGGLLLGEGLQQQQAVNAQERRRVMQTRLRWLLSCGICRRHTAILFMGWLWTISLGSRLQSPALQYRGICSAGKSSCTVQ